MSPRESEKSTSLPVDSPLARLLSAHENTGFITLLDKSSLSRKRVVFLKALILNVGLLPLMTWLTYTIVVRDVLTTLPTNPMGIFHLSQDLIIIWAVSSLLINTTIPFFFGECPLRLRRGFRPIDVVFLSLPTLDSSLPPDVHFEHYQRLAACADPNIAYTCFQPLLTGDTSFIISYPAILDAYNLIDSGEIDVEELDSVLWMRRNVNWSICQVSKVEQTA